jgi:branched-chain amino acid transport system permease protein
VKTTDRISTTGATDYRVVTSTPASLAIAIALCVLVAILIALPAFAGRDVIEDLIFVFYMSALAQCWNLLAGQAGLVSVGQQAFVGLGGYLLFAFAILSGVDPLAAVVLAGILSAAFAVPTAFVVFRLRGAYFAIGTWVVAEVYRLVIAQFKQLGGGTGTSLPPSITNEIVGIERVRLLFGVRTPAARDIISYWLALALAAGTVAFVYLILRSRRGLTLGAIRDSETAAESVGVNIFRIKLGIYVATAAITGMIGAVIYLQKARISPDAAFSVLDWTAYVIFIVVIGGIGTIEGPILGTLIFYLMQHYLASFGAWYLILLGALAISVMLFAPQGLWGFVSGRYGVVLFPIRRRLVVNGGEQLRAMSGREIWAAACAALAVVRRQTEAAVRQSSSEWGLQVYRVLARVRQRLVSAFLAPARRRSRAARVVALHAYRSGLSTSVRAWSQCRVAANAAVALVGQQATAVLCPRSRLLVAAVRRVLSAAHRQARMTYLPELRCRAAFLAPARRRSRAALAVALHAYRWGLSTSVRAWSQCRVAANASVALVRQQATAVLCPRSRLLVTAVRRVLSAAHRQARMTYLPELRRRGQAVRRVFRSFMGEL